MSERPQPDLLDPDVRRAVDGFANALTITALAAGLILLAAGCLARWAL